MKVLIIDDSIIDVFIVKALLSKVVDMEDIYSFEGGYSGIEFLKNCDSYPDYILVDINMPLMDGFSFVETIKELNITSKIIIVSSSKSEEDYEKAKDLGALFVPKPLSINILKEILI